MLWRADPWPVLGRFVAALAAIGTAASTVAGAQNESPRAPDERPTVMVRVYSGDGKPLAAALGSIVKVEPPGKVSGEGGNDPACHPDSGRHAASGVDGLLLLDELDSDMSYTIFLESKEHIAKTIVVEPKTPHVLLEVTLAPADERNRVGGLVLLPDGSPAFDAHVVVRAMNAKVRAGHYDSEAATDKEGRFVLYGGGAWGPTTVSVEAEGCVPNQIFTVSGGTKVNTLQLIAGAKIRGRVLRHARGAAGVVVTLVPIPTMPTGRAALLPANGAALANPRHTTTDAFGRYTFEHVEPEHEHQLFVPMTAVAEDNLFAHRQNIRSGIDGQTRDVAELNLHPAHRLSGKIITADGRKPPAGTVVVLERGGAQDLQQTRIDGEGRFAFAAVPSEGVVLSFHTPGNQYVNGYRLSGRNFSLDAAGATLRGRIDDDRQLLVLFEAGAATRYSAGDVRAPMNVVGVRNAGAQGAVVQRVVVQQGGKRVVVSQVVQQAGSGHELDPLAGVREADLPRGDDPRRTSGSSR